MSAGFEPLRSSRPSRSSWRPPADLSRIVERYVTVLDLTAFCHVPADEPLDPGALAEGGDATDRWSVADQPTVYLASDAGVVLAELGRHARGEGGGRLARRILRLELEGLRLLDLHEQAVVEALRIANPPSAFLDRVLARAVGCAIRATDRCDGIRVPSMALLDEPERHCIVVFADRIPGGFTARIAACEIVGEVWAGA